MIDCNPFHEVARTLRHKRGYTLRELELRIPFGKNTIHRFESGNKLPASMDEVKVYAGGLDCTVDEHDKLMSAYVFSILVSGGVDRLVACEMITGSATPTKQVDQLFHAANEAIKHGAYNEALRWLIQLQTLHGRLETMTLQQELMLSEAYYGSGDLPQAREHFEKVISLLNHRLPTSKNTVWLLGGQVFQQVGHRLKIDVFKKSLHQVKMMDSKELQALIQAISRLSHISYVNDNPLLTTYYSVKGLNIAEKAYTNPKKTVAYQAEFYANMAIVSDAIGMKHLAEQYGRYANENIFNIDDKHLQSRIFLVTGVFNFGRGKWTEAIQHFTHGKRIAKQIGDLRRYAECQAFLATVYYWQGSWPDGIAMVLEIGKIADKNDDSQIIGYVQFIKIVHALHRDEVELGDTNFIQCLRLVEESSDQLLNIEATGLLSQLYQRHNEFDLAHKYAKRVLEKTKPVLGTSGSLEGIYRVAESFLYQLEKNQTKENRAAAIKACKHLQKLAKTFAPATPLSLTYMGWHAWLKGKRKKAFLLGERGVLEAQRLQMPYHEGMARYHLGRNQMVHDPSNQNGVNNLKIAGEIFQKLGTVFELNQVQALLGTESFV